MSKQTNDRRPSLSSLSNKTATNKNQDKTHTKRERNKAFKNIIGKRYPKRFGFDVAAERWTMWIRYSDNLSIVINITRIGFDWTLSPAGNRSSFRILRGWGLVCSFSGMQIGRRSPPLGDGWVIACEKLPKTPHRRSHNISGLARIRIALSRI